MGPASFRGAGLRDQYPLQSCAGGEAIAHGIDLSPERIVAGQRRSRRPVSQRAGSGADRAWFGAVERSGSAGVELSATPAKGYWIPARWLADVQHRPAASNHAGHGAQARKSVV